MITINNYYDIKKISDPYIFKYVNSLIENIFKEYHCNYADSLKPIGVIFVVESIEDWKLLSENELGLNINNNRFEWIDDIGNAYCDGCIVINNSNAVNIIGKKIYFKDYLEDFI